MVVPIVIVAAASTPSGATVKTVQTPCRNSGNSGVGWSWLELGLGLYAMPLLLVGSQRSRTDWSNSETLVILMSSR